MTVISSCASCGSSPSQSTSGSATPPTPTAPPGPTTLAAGAWTELPALVVPRRQHTVTTHADGALLVIGGVGADGRALDSIELLAPRAPAWVVIAHLGQARTHHAATALADGRILVSGGLAGIGSDSVLASTEVIDVDARTVTPGPPLVHSRWGHEGLIAGTGDLWVVGGTDGAVPMSPEILRGGGTAFANGPDTEPHANPGVAWTTSTGVVVAIAGLSRNLAPIPKYGRWLSFGRQALPPAINALAPNSGALLAHTLPPAAEIAAAPTSRGTIVLTAAARLQAWMFDPSSRTFAAIAAPPFDRMPELFAAPGDTVVAMTEESGARFIAGNWTPIVPPPADLAMYATAATPTALVVVGGIDRSRADRGVTGRVVALAM